MGNVSSFPTCYPLSVLFVFVYCDFYCLYFIFIYFMSCSVVLFNVHFYVDFNNMCIKCVSILLFILIFCSYCSLPWRIFLYCFLFCVVHVKLLFYVFLFLLPDFWSSLYNICSFMLSVLVYNATTLISGPDNSQVKLMMLCIRHVWHYVLLAGCFP